MIENFDDGVAAEEESNVLTASMEHHCPFGCRGEDVDERGYCDHLIGFSNDKKIMERVVPIMRRSVDENGTMGPPEKTGHYRVLGRKHQVRPIPKGSKLVNPQVEQKVNGARFLAYRWVSWRVYHNEPERAKAEGVPPAPKKTVTVNEAGTEE